MLRHLLIAAHVFVLLCHSVSGQSAERIALLPFTEEGVEQSARSMVSAHARQLLIRRGFSVAAEDSVLSALRDLRIRNTAAPTPHEIRELCAMLDVTSIITGAIHRFSAESTFTEAALCARMIRAEDTQVLWSNCAVSSGGGNDALLSIPAHGQERLAKGTVKKVFSSLKASLKQPDRRVSGMTFRTRKGRLEIPCQRVAIIPPADESEAQYASLLFTDLLASEMRRRGFTVLDAGSVRSLQLQSEDLRYGQAVDVVSRALADSLDVDLVITGAVSGFTSSRLAGLGSVPEVSLELRMIEPKRNLVLWATNLRRTGQDKQRFFKLGAVHSPARLAQDMIHDFANDLHVTRSHVTSTNQP